MKDATAYDKSANRVYFITKEFNDGTFLAHYSDAPWGHVHNQERGRVIIKVMNQNTGVIVDEYSTYYWGSTGAPGSFNEWMFDMKKEHGGYKRVVYNDSDKVWTMEE
jgi:hypothetical protein